jgi:hypothetical protein
MPDKLKQRIKEDYSIYRNLVRLQINVMGLGLDYLYKYVMRQVRFSRDVCI